MRWSVLPAKLPDIRTLASAAFGAVGAGVGAAAGAGAGAGFCTLTAAGVGSAFTAGASALNNTNVVVPAGWPGCAFEG